MDTNYIEIGEQIFNLVDNEKDKMNSFYDAMAKEDERSSIQTWFDDNVKDNELQDLYKQGQNNDGLLNWITSEEGHTYFMQTPIEINSDNIDSSFVTPKGYKKPTKSEVQKDIEQEDDDIMSDDQIRIKKDMSDGDYVSDEVDNDNEIMMALDALENSEDDDINIVFDIIDSSDEDSSEEEVRYEDDSDSSEEDEEEIIHKKRIHLDHHVNKVVEEIDSNEETDRLTHKKYYVMKKAELGTTENMNKLEDELDKENISYYDFGKDNTIAIKIYSQNEVRLNRIFESLGFESRCVDIAHYTDNWYSVS